MTHPFVQRIVHRGKELALRADDLDGGSGRARRDRDTGDQPATADGDHDRVQVGDLVEHLDADGALSRNDAWIVVRVDERHPA